MHINSIDEYEEFPKMNPSSQVIHYVLILVK